MLRDTWRSWWDCWLQTIEPKGIDDPVMRHRARMLNSAFLVLSPTGLIILLLDAILERRTLSLQDAPLTVTLAAIGCIFIVRFLSNSGRYRTAIWMLVTLAIVSIWIVGDRSSPPHLEIAYIVVVPMLGSIFFNGWGSLAITVLSMGVMITFFVVKNVPANTANDVLWIFVIVSVIYFFLQYQRNVLEQDRNRLATERIALEAERERARLMHEFMRSAAHDLRTPLAVLNTNLYLLGKSSDADAAAERRDTMQRMVKRIETMLDSMFLLVRVEADRPVDALPVDVGTALASALSRVAKLAEGRGVKLDTSIASTLPRLNGSLNELEIALTHLIKNAVQYTPAGGQVRVCVYAHAQGGLTIDVMDTGVGISAEDLPHIFERFYRGEKHRPIEDSHVGLGLSLAHKIVERHGGKLSVTSEVGSGSMFTVWLPAA